MPVLWRSVLRFLTIRCLVCCISYLLCSNYYTRSHRETLYLELQLLPASMSSKILFCYTIIIRLYYIIRAKTVVYSRSQRSCISVDHRADKKLGWLARCRGVSSEESGSNAPWAMRAPLMVFGRLLANSSDVDLRRFADRRRREQITGTDDEGDDKQTLAALCAASCQFRHGDSDAFPLLAEAQPEPAKRDKERQRRRDYDDDDDDDAQLISAFVLSVLTDDCTPVCLYPITIFLLVDHITSIFSWT